MKVSHLKRLKEFDDETQKFNQMYSNVSLDNKMHKCIMSKKVLKPSDKGHRVSFLLDKNKVIINRD